MILKMQDDGFELTELSDLELSKFYNENMPAAEALQYLKRGMEKINENDKNEAMPVRKFGSMLKRFAKLPDNSPDEEIKKLVVEGLCNIDPAANKDTITRKVTEWLRGSYKPADREMYIKICFVLNLDENKSKNFLSILTDGSFHMRNPRELIYLYCIRRKKPYSEAQEMLKNLPVLPGLNQTKKAESKAIFTKLIEKSFNNISDDESFVNFYNQNLEKFGYLHNTAYKRFEELSELLAKPPAYVTDDKSLSKNNIARDILRMNLPYDKKRKNYDVLKKIISERWPNATLISNIHNRHVDVTRKILILMYLLTAEYSDQENGYANPYCVPEKQFMFDVHYCAINDMLNYCGMSKLDPRNIFDWIVLFSIKAGTDDDELISERMENIIRLIFEDV